jgi:hypothetical protein
VLPPPEEEAAVLPPPEEEAAVLPPPDGVAVLPPPDGVAVLPPPDEVAVLPPPEEAEEEQDVPLNKFKITSTVALGLAGDAEEEQDVPLNKFKPPSPVVVAAPAPAHDIEPEAALVTKFGLAPATAPVELASAPELQIVLPALLAAEPLEF